LELQSLFIDEPYLTFGDGNKHIDPKMGLLLYGPCLHPNRRIMSTPIRLGVIGSKETIDLTREWVERCRMGIAGKEENPVLFPSFPGFSKIFGSELRVLDECIEQLTDDEIKNVIRIGNFNRRVQRAANIIIEKLENLRIREPRPHVVICALPQQIVDYCAVKKGRRVELTKEERKILRTIRKLRKIGQTTLFPFNEEETLYGRTSNLRRIVKAKAMQLGIPTQFVWPRTLKPGTENETLQPEATRAWNLSVALYYKAEGYPWKLAEMPTGTCYVGITFYRTHNQENVRSSLAQVFTHTGEGLVLRGGRAIVDKITRSTHLSEKAAYRLLEDALNLYERQMRTRPTRLVIHKSSRFWPDELSGFKKAAEGIELVDLVAIESRGIRFMRRTGKYPPRRGTALRIGENDYILFTKGYIQYFKTYPGLRVPIPIEIIEHHGDTPMKEICKEILALTKMNWNSADFCIREPVTLAYSRRVGEILSYMPEHITPCPEYRFYM